MAASKFSTAPRAIKHHGILTKGESSQASDENERVSGESTLPLLCAAIT